MHVMRKIRLMRELVILAALAILGCTLMSAGYHVDPDWLAYTCLTGGSIICVGVMLRAVGLAGQ